MFTVCPKCALTLVVTAADLRVAQGYVRCGRCSNVFNAIAALSEDRHGSAGSQASAASSTASTTIMRKAPSIADMQLPQDPNQDPNPDPLSATGETEAVYAEPDAEEVQFQEVFTERELFVEAPPPKPAPAPQPASASALAPARKASVPPPPAEDDPDFIPETALEFNADSTDVSKVFIEAPPPRTFDWKRGSTGAFETIVLKSEDDGPLPEPPPVERDPVDVQLESELRSLAARLDASGDQPGPRRPAANEATIEARGSPYNSADNPSNLALQASKRAARAGAETNGQSGLPETPLNDEAAAEAAAQELTPPPAPRGRRTAWIVGIAVLGVVLVAQTIHHNRHDLATNARLNRPLTRFYAAIGVPLVPHWDLASYDVRQLGASTSAGDTSNLTVRASLKNTASQALPLPLLRITVQDRYGNRIATRDVPPQGYVPGVVPQGAHLGVGQRIDAEMTFKDPGRDAVGFEIDACLPTPGGGIACANDLPTGH